MPPPRVAVPVRFPSAAEDSASSRKTRCGSAWKRDPRNMINENHSSVRRMLVGGPGEASLLLSSRPTRSQPSAFYAAIISRFFKWRRFSGRPRNRLCQRTGTLPGRFFRRSPSEEVRNGTRISLGQQRRLLRRIPDVSASVFIRSAFPSYFISDVK